MRKNLLLILASVEKKAKTCPGGSNSELSQKYVQVSNTTVSFTQCGDYAGEKRYQKF